jgi:hypothetical protein
MDRIFEFFLRRQYEDGMALADQSDLLELLPVGPEPVQRYVARFRCNTLVRGRRGEITEAAEFAVAFFFAADFLRCVRPLEAVTWLGPDSAFHPNVRPPLICVGRIPPGTSLVELLYQAHAVGTGAKVTVQETDALNWDACAWARRNQHRYPADRRPLKRAEVDFAVEEIR